MQCVTGVAEREVGVGLERGLVAAVPHDGLGDLRLNALAGEGGRERASQGVEIGDAAIRVDMRDACGLEILTACPVGEGCWKHQITGLRLIWLEGLQDWCEGWVKRQTIKPLGLATRDSQETKLEVDLAPREPNQIAATEAGK